eukprot:Hpha_TRINITY_DN16548_c1_g1::TRINITY_DN16548_c1_g1_i8::g.133399::m.133399
MLVLVTVNSSDLLHPEVRAPNALPVGALQTVTEDGRDHGDQRLGDLARRNFHRVVQLHGDLLLQHLLHGIRRRLVDVGDLVSLGQLLARVQHRARRLCVRDPPLHSLLLVQARVQRAPFHPPAPELSVPSLLLSLHRHHLVLVVHPAGTVRERERQHVAERRLLVTGGSGAEPLHLAHRLRELIVLHLQELLLLLKRRELRRRRRRPVVEEDRRERHVPRRRARRDLELLVRNPRRHGTALPALVTTLLAHFVRLALLLVVELSTLSALPLVTLAPVLLPRVLGVSALLHLITTHGARSLLSAV